MAIFTRDKTEDQTVVNGAASHAPARAEQDPPAAANGASAVSGDPVGDGSSAGRVCEQCGAPLLADQEWCLECGTAVRPGTADRWRLPAAIVAAVVLIAGAATTLAFLGLSDSSKHQVAAVKGQAPPPVAPTPPATPPAVSTPPAAGKASPKVPIPGVTTPPATGATPPAVANPKTAVTPPTGATPKTPAKKRGTGRSGLPNLGSTTPTTKKQPRRKRHGKLAPLAIDANSIRVFDPYGDGNERPDLAGLAVDGDPSTAWQTNEYPDGYLAKAGVGLVVKTKQATAATQLRLQTLNPGWSVEVYGTADDPPPPKLPATDWVKLGSSSSVNADSQIDLASQGQKYSSYLVWVTGLAPQNTNATIAEISLSGSQ